MIRDGGKIQHSSNINLKNDNISLHECKHDKINLGLFDVTKITEFINSVVAFPVNSSLIFDGKNHAWRKV